jgi:hypothetical protein
MPKSSVEGAGDEGESHDQERRSMREVNRRRWRVEVAVAIFVLGVVALWSPAAASDLTDARVFVLPFEIDADFGAANGDAILGRFLPVNTIVITDRWKLVNVALVTVADAPGGRPGEPGNPNPIPSPRVFGLADFTDALVISPNKRNKLRWGVGFAIGVPTATDPALGSGKWQAGPAFRLSYLTGPWRFALLATNRWSFAGDSNRADTNQLLARGLVRRQLGERWFFISAPIITANWNAPSGQTWLVPLGGGFGRSFPTRSASVNLSLQAYANVIEPDGAPDWVIRLGMTFPLKLPERER